MKTLSFIICYFLFIGMLQSQSIPKSGEKITNKGNFVDKDMARVMAQRFLSDLNVRQHTKKSVEILTLSESKTLKVNDEPALYIFSNQGVGFIIISADSALTPVIGYSFDGSFPEHGVSQNFDNFLETYLDQIAWVREHPSSKTPEIQARWKMLLEGKTNFSNKTANGVEPLLTSRWSQGYPYNALCPKESRLKDNHVPVGCAATAVSMIMYYYRYPLQGKGSYYYPSMYYGTQLVNFAASRYDWDSMLDHINAASGQCIPAVAQLLYHVGVSLRTEYTPLGSIIYLYDVAQPLIEHFGYNPLTKNLRRTPKTISNEEWENIVTAQLDSLNPVYLAGSNLALGVGHAFVCDGYEVIGTEKFFHMNFGWGGDQNGYYTLHNPLGFDLSQNLLQNFYPVKGYPYGCRSQLITSTDGSFEDGSSPKYNYKPNLNCTWLIAPTDSVNSITLSFIAFNVDVSDSLLIYDGDNETAALLSVYSGANIPPAITSSGRKLFLKFTTNGSNESKGWIAEYHSTFPDLCTEKNTLTSPYGIVTDGSGSHNYYNNGTCKWKIEPPDVDNLTLSFNYFDLEQNDSLIVYSVSATESTTKIGTFTGNIIPTQIVAPTNNLLLVLKTNEFNTAGGFEAEYSSSIIVSSESKVFHDVKLSPNPAKEYTVLSFSNTKEHNVLLSIRNMIGKQLHSEILETNNSNFEKKISLSGYNPGMYILSLKNVNDTKSYKLIVK